MTPHDEPHETLLAYHEGRLDDDARRRVEGLCAADPAWRAHLDSLADLEADRARALRDARRLARLGLADATELCLLVARTPDDVLPALLERRRSAPGCPRREWADHLKACPFCARSLRDAAARRQADRAGVAGPLLRDRILAPLYAPALRQAADRLRSDFHDVAVLFADLVGSTPYGEQFGGQMSYYLSDRLEALLRELVVQHRGAWERIEGDGALLFFERPADAARCALTLQRRLARYNAAEAEADAHRLAVRVGIHHGRCRVVRRPAGWRLYGPVANTAKRVEQAGAGEDSPILLSRAAASHLSPDDFHLRPFRTIQAKGLAEPLELYRLDWREPDGAARPPSASLTPQPATLESPRAVATLLLSADGRAHVARVRARTGRAPRGEVRTPLPLDLARQERARAAVAAAFRAVAPFGLAADPAEYCVEWDIDGPGPPLDGPSFELALAVATAASLTGGRAPRAVVAGAVEGDTVAPIAGLEARAALLLHAPSGTAPRPPFDTLLLPRPNHDSLPHRLRREHHLVENRPFRCVGVATVADAVREALGASLGAPDAALDRLAAARGAAATAHIDLWVEPAVAPPAARDMVLPRAGGQASFRWRVGDRLLARARADRDGHLALFNINPLGEVTVLLPNERRKVAPLRAGHDALFPAPEDDLDFELAPPTGRERLVALATAHPLPLTPTDLGQDAGLICARLTARELDALADRHAPSVLARAETTFEVDDAPPLATRGAPPPAPDDEPSWAPFVLG